MSDHIRRLIPRDHDGREPCLRFFVGGMCYGRSVSRCAHQRRTHRWVAENCKISSSASTTRTAATPVAVTVLEKPEALTVRRRFGIHAKPM
ncbi:hypothetical protein PI125_g21748 [Phytophthora idaei]|nr:hypothetical protein PI125_g21748 [Phytophthora idaei]